MTHAPSTQPALTYKTAMAQLKRNAKSGDTTTVTWDAGDGFTARGYYCAWRKRIVTETVTPTGAIIH